MFMKEHLSVRVVKVLEDLRPRVLFWSPILLLILVYHELVIYFTGTVQ